MPKVKALAVDQRSIILRTVEARRGFTCHTELARESGMKETTMRKRFREPGTMTLDEAYRVTKGNITPEEALQLLRGGN